tara:strand:+ start:562 stop:2139 length:1578 start_codon:yes stop_codon:yes gene_type:complete
MPVITKIFDFEGGVRIADIPRGTTKLTMHLYGGGGGGGATENPAAGDGGVASAGHYVTKTDFDMTSFAGVKLISVSVGGGGEAGTLGAGAAGGRNGKGLSNYSGGTGGTAGPESPSGSGGGGGGATVVTIFSDGASIEQSVIAVAGGGAGGGGGASFSSGGTGSNSNTATSESPSTLGENGARHSTDGAGAGGGGGGAAGGKGGSTEDGDVGGLGGTAGSNTVPSSGSAEDGSGATPGGKTSGYYVTGVAEGGTADKNGGNGRAVLIFTIEGGTNFKTGGEYKTIDKIYAKVSGAWKNIVAGYVKVSGEWKTIFTGDIIFSINFALFGNATGNPASGSVGGNAPAGPFGGNLDNDPGGGRIIRPPCKKLYHGPITIPGAPNGYQCKSNEKGGGRVICTYFHDRGEMDPLHLKNDYHYTIDHISDATKIGYWFWAIPLTNYMHRHEFSTKWWPKLVTDTTRLFATERAKAISHKMGATKKGSVFGTLIRIIGEPMCTIIGMLVKPFVAEKYKFLLEDLQKEGKELS